MELSGWGRFPRASVRLCQPAQEESALAALREGETQRIARGLGRSYGDAALADSVIDTRRLDHLISFDRDSGELHCQAGVSLAQLLQHFMPLGWLPPVLPGTRFVSVGGAIASDVHGKNHHRDGSFSDWVVDLHIATVSQGIVRCSRDEHPENPRASPGHDLGPRSRWL